LNDIWDQDLGICFTLNYFEYILNLNCAEKGICNVGVVTSCILTGKPTLEWYEDDHNGLFGRQDGKFSGGQGLFDDVEDTSGSLWNTKDKLTIDKGTCQ
jgi:hypothetical protein